MALVVEDGTGLANAESYCSVAAATAFHASIGASDSWDAVENKEAALRKATQFLTKAYNGRWAGKRATAMQALDWPRSGVRWDDSPSGWRSETSVPVEVRNATAELALKSEAGDLLQDVGRETLSESVGEISVTYAQGSERQTTYASADGWLSSLLASSGGMIKVFRS